jgi:chemotaxis protein MotB
MKHNSIINGWFLSFIVVSMYLVSCVPAKQLEDMQKKEKECQTQNSKLKTDNDALTTKNTELKAQMDDIHKRITNLEKDTSEEGSALRRLTSLYDELMKSYDKLLSNNEKLLTGNTQETQKLIATLNSLKEELQKKEDQLKHDEQGLNALQISLRDREAKVSELQSILDKKDSVVTALKKAVSDALLGFENNGLTVSQKNGKVYVSLEEQLLFASGSTVVEKKGEEALKKLAGVLEKNKDINILVEGHTDDVPISGTLASGAKDNWELSVLRATSVVKIITKNSVITPSRLTAAGRGPYVPVETGSSADVKRKNRRTEIILTPKLDELLKALETN